jgi:hypothetical protein
MKRFKKVGFGVAVAAVIVGLTGVAGAASSWTTGKYDDNTNSKGVDLGKSFVFSKTSIKSSSGLVEKVKRAGLTDGTEKYSTSGKSVKSLLKADKIQFQTLVVTSETVPSSLAGGFCGKKPTKYLVLADFGDGELSVAAFSAKPGSAARDSDLCGIYNFIKNP